MGYTLNLSDISLMDYQGLLRQQNLLPGRRMLLEELDARFAAFADLGLTTVAQLKASLATPQKMASLVQKTGIPEEYLVILRRELGSLTQKPVSLVEFRDCDPSRIDSLAAIGIRTSQTLWECGNDASAELFALCDLVRINGVGAAAARAFYEAGYVSVGAVAEANAADMLVRVSAVNTEKGYYKARLGKKDMQFCIDYAKLLEKYS